MKSATLEVTIRELNEPKYLVLFDIQSGLVATQPHARLLCYLAQLQQHNWWPNKYVVSVRSNNGIMMPTNSHTVTDKYSIRSNCLAMIHVFVNNANFARHVSTTDRARISRRDPIHRQTNCI